MNPKNHTKRVALLLLLFALCTGTLAAQTPSFTYQGKLSDGGTAANGNYDLQFALFDSAAGGNQIGATQTVNTVAVSTGIFSVTLDFGASAFPGTSRYLEIRAKTSGGGAFTTLAPRQQISSTPYAIRSANATTADTATNATTATTATNATQLGGVAASQYVQTNDARLSDARAPAAGSSNYIQNSNVPQAGANFNVTGNGTAGGTLSANAVNATTQYNIGGFRALSIAGENNTNTFVGQAAGGSNTSGTSNSFFGRAAGVNNTTAGGNSFFGSSAGANNTAGGNNSFFGSRAGTANNGQGNSFFGAFAGTLNTTGSDNAFFGREAGSSNTTATANAFFGRSAGSANTTGAENSFFGFLAGSSNTTAANNSFFGTRAGYENTTGHSNSFFGREAGRENTTGYSNSFFGREAGEVNTTGHDNSFFGLAAGNKNTTGSENSFFGRSAGAADTIGYSNSFFGFESGKANTTGNVNSFFGIDSGSGNTAGIGNTFFGNAAGSTNTTGDFNTAIGYLANVGSANLTNATAIGARAVVSTSNTILLGRTDGSDKVRVPGLSTAGATAVCRNALAELSTCSSSRRYKEQIFGFGGGLNLLSRLRPVQFVWKADQQPDLGLVAEEVAEVEPLLVIHNDKGEIEGVKYSHLNVVLINAIKQQQDQIERHQAEAKQQHAQIEALQLANTALNSRLRTIERIVSKRVVSARLRQ